MDKTKSFESIKILSIKKQASPLHYGLWNIAFSALMPCLSLKKGSSSSLNAFKKISKR
jgi:hypothetical protein